MSHIHSIQPQSGVPKGMSAVMVPIENVPVAVDMLEGIEDKYRCIAFVYRVYPETDNSSINGVWLIEVLKGQYTTIAVYGDTFTNVIKSLDKAIGNLDYTIHKG